MLRIWSKKSIGKGRKARRRKDDIIFFLIICLLFASCQKHKSSSTHNCILDSIEVYKKYKFSNSTALVQSKIVYYGEVNDTVDYLQTNRLIKFYHSDGYRHTYIIMDEPGYSLESIILINSDIISFRRALLLNNNKQVVDTVTNNNAKLILYLDGEKIKQTDSVNMKKTIPFKPLEKS